MSVNLYAKLTMDKIEHTHAHTDPSTHAQAHKSIKTQVPTHPRTHAHTQANKSIKTHAHKHTRTHEHPLLKPEENRGNTVRVVGRVSWVKRGWIM